MLKKTRFSAMVTLGVLLSCCSGQAQERGTQVDAINHAAQTEEKADKTKEIDMQKLSEAFGNFIGRNLQSPGLKFDLEHLIKGIRNGSTGEASPLSEKEYEEMMSLVQERAFKEMSTANLKSADDFMHKNRSTDAIVEIVPGKLQFLILKEGTGPLVESHSSPKIHYTGKYQDGTVFGTSEEMGGPITIPLDQTIPGFSKGILGMKEGEKRRLFVHPDLGYGTTGQLPPNELLIFDIEVVQSNDEEKSKAKLSGDKKSDASHLNGDGDDNGFDDDDLEEDSQLHKKSLDN